MYARILMAWLALIGCAMFIQAATPASEPSEAPAGVTVAILNYETSVPGNPELGTQIADLLTAHLSVEESLELVERGKLADVLSEQKLKLVGLVDQEQAAKVGKLLGAKLLVMGKAFVLDKKLVIVSRIVGVETGRVVGSILEVEMSKPISQATTQLAADLAALARKNAAKLLPANSKMADPVEDIRKQLAQLGRPAVAVVIPEEHIRQRVIDPAVETEIKKVLVDCGYKLVDPGKNDLADWAKNMMKDKAKPWPQALDKADVVVVGEAFSEFAVRTGDLVTCTGRAEINVIDRTSGEILLADRHTTRAIDLAEATAGKTALQAAGRKLGVAIARKLLDLAQKMPNPAPKAPDQKVSFNSCPADAHTPARSRVLLCGPLPPSPATTQAATQAARRVLFVTPFGNETAQEQYDPAANGIGDLIGMLLARQENVTVVERQRLLELTAEQARSLEGLTDRQYAVQAGKLLLADTALVGRLFMVQGKMMVSVQAIDIASSRVVAADQIACQPSQLVETALQSAQQLAKQMAIPLPAIELGRIDKSPIASLHFAKALSHFYTGNMDAAIMQFMRAVDLDPDYVEAHYWSGMAYSRLGEDAHAIIEWEEFLGRRPKSPLAPGLKKLLAQARERDSHSTVPRLGPTSKPVEKAK